MCDTMVIQLMSDELSEEESKGYPENLVWGLSDVREVIRCSHRRLIISQLTIKSNNTFGPCFRSSKFRFLVLVLRDRDRDIRFEYSNRNNALQAVARRPRIKTGICMLQYVEVKLGKTLV